MRTRCSRPRGSTTLRGTSFPRVPLHQLPFLHARTVQFRPRYGVVTENGEVRASEIPHLTKHGISLVVAWHQ
jgi:hypothetical protein